MNDYLLHKNGRGRLYGDSEANRATYIDRTSSASGSAKLRDCRLTFDSHVGDECQVYGGHFIGANVSGRTVIAGNPVIDNCYIDCSGVSGKPWMIGAQLLGLTEVCDCPTIKSARLESAVIYGNPTIIGNFTVTGRIHEGTWTRAPKHVKLPWVDISECVDNKIMVACWCRPIAWWLEFGPRKALADWGWSQDQVDVTMATIRREFPMRQAFTAEEVSEMTRQHVQKVLAQVGQP